MTSRRPGATSAQLAAILAALSAVGVRVERVVTTLGEGPARPFDADHGEALDELRRRAIAARASRSSVASVVPRSLADFLA